LPLSPLSHPSAHITLFTMTTSTMTAFFIRGYNTSSPFLASMSE
jgi:hypothetical protein